MNLCLASIHPRALSGQVGCLVALARSLQAAGHTVRLATAFPEDALLAGDRVALASADHGWLLPKMLRMKRVLDTMRECSKTADLVHFNLPTPAFGWIADLVQPSLSAPLIVGYEAETVVARDVFSHGRMLAAPQFYVPLFLLNNGQLARFSRHRASRYVVSSETQAADLARSGHPRDRIAVIPNLVDLAVNDRPSKAEARRRLGLPDGPLIGYLGHFNHVKGVDVLIRALPSIRERVPSARLVLAWSGLGSTAPVDRALRESGVRDQVIMLGRVTARDLYSAVDLLVQPYRMTSGQSAFPEVVLEAMAVGVPLVTSDLPLLHEAIGGDDGARFVTVDSSSAVAKASAELLLESEVAVTMVAAQRRRIQASFDSASLTSRYEALYRSVAGAYSLRKKSAIGAADRALPK